MPDDGGYYKNYPDEAIAMARWYYDEGHLYDNKFTWTNSTDVDVYRNVSNVWEWWGNGEPSLAEITATTTPPDTPKPLRGDVNQDGAVTIADALLLCRWLVRDGKPDAAQAKLADVNEDGIVTGHDAALLKSLLLVK